VHDLSGIGHLDFGVWVSLFEDGDPHAAQDRGEVAGQGKPSKGEGLATTADIGLTHKDIHEARQVRDVEAADPGVTSRALNEILHRES
jgi:hypothetical protein